MPKWPKACQSTLNWYHGAKQKKTIPCLNPFTFKILTRNGVVSSCLICLCYWWKACGGHRARSWQPICKRKTLLPMWISWGNWDHGDIGRELKGRGDAEREAKKNVELNKNQLKKRKKTLIAWNQASVPQKTWVFHSVRTIGPDKILADPSSFQSNLGSSSSLWGFLELRALSHLPKTLSLSNMGPETFHEWPNRSSIKLFRNRSVGDSL